MILKDFRFVRAHLDGIVPDQVTLFPFSRFGILVYFSIISHVLDFVDALEG